MRTLILAQGVSATAVANQSAVTLVATPFLAGRDVVSVIDGSGVTGTPTFVVQGSDDNSTWVTLHTSTSLGHHVANIKLRQYMRFGVTVVGTAGIVSSHLDNGA